MSKSIKDFKKGDKIIFNWNNEKYQGVVIGNPYRFINDNERYVEVQLYEYGEEMCVNVQYLEKIEG